MSALNKKSREVWYSIFLAMAASLSMATPAGSISNWHVRLDALAFPSPAVLK